MLFALQTSWLFRECVFFPVPKYVFLEGQGTYRHMGPIYAPNDLWDSCYPVELRNCILQFCVIPGHVDVLVDM